MTLPHRGSSGSLWPFYFPLMQISFRTVYTGCLNCFRAALVGIQAPLDVCPERLSLA